MKIYDLDNLLTISVRVIVMFAGLISSILTAQALGPEGRGELITIMTLGLTVANFSYLGFPSSNTYFIADNIKIINPVYYNSLIISFFGATIAFLSPFIFFDNSELFKYEKAIFLFFFVFATMFSSFLSNILVAVNQVRAFNLLDFFQNFSVLILYLICYILELSIIYFLISSLFGSVVGLVIGVYNIKKYLIYPKNIIDIDLFIKSFKYAIKVYITTFIGFLIVRGNILVLEKYQSTYDVGIFSVSLQIYEAIIIIPAAISLLLLPRLIRINKNDRWINMNNVLKQVSIIMILICVIIYMLMPIVIPLFFGNNFYPSIEIANYLLPGAFFLGILSVVSQYLASIGYPIMQVVFWVLAFFLWAILSFIFIPDYGSKATAIIMSLVNFILFITLYILSIKLRKNV